MPDKLMDVLKSFQDFTVCNYGIDCDLYIPTNITALEGNDAYTSPDDYAFKKYARHKVWINWAETDIQRLRKLGLFTEKNAPIIAYFKNFPVVTLQSYIKVDTRYIPDDYDTDEFEVTDVLMRHTYNAEVVRSYKLAPRRAKNT